MSTVKIKQVRSAAKTNPNQKATLKALGWGGSASPSSEGLAAAAGAAPGRLPPGRGRRWLRKPTKAKTRASRAEEIGLHNLKPKPGSKRPRKRIGRGEGSGLGKTSGRGHKGAGSRSGAQAQGRLRGRAEPDPHADAKAARPAQKAVDAVRELPHQDPAGQPLRPRGALRRRRRGDARRRSRRRAWRSAPTRSRSSPAARSRRSSRSTRTPSARPPRRRSRRPAVPATLWSR